MTNYEAICDLCVRDTLQKSQDFYGKSKQRIDEAYLAEVLVEHSNSNIIDLAAITSISSIYLIIPKKLVSLH